MNRFFSTCCLLSACAAAVLFSTANFAEGGLLLFSDTFDSTTVSSDVNYNISARTSGQYSYDNAGTTWVPKTGGINVGLGELSAGGTGAPLNGNGPDYGCMRIIGNTGGGYYAWATIDHSFSGADSAGGLEIVLKAAVNKTVSNSDWFGFIIGNTSNAGGRAAGSGIEVILRHGTRNNAETSANMYVNENGVYGNGYSSTSEKTWFTPASSAEHSFRFVIEGLSDGINPFDGAVKKIHVALFIDGGTTDVLDYTSTQSKAWTGNYISLEGPGGGLSTPLFDEITVSKIPEPGTLALLAGGLAGLLAYAWRKRR